MANIENNTDEEKYKILLENAYENCKNQDSRKENFDTKTSYMFTFTSVLIGIIIQYIDIGEIVKEIFSVSLSWITVFKLTLLYLYIADIVLCVVAIFFYVGIINSRPYNTLDTELLKNEEQIKSKSVLEIEKKMTEFYANITLDNSKRNDKISNQYKHANILVLIALCFTIALFMILKIL